MPDQLKDRLKRARITAALSQAELAKKIGVAQPTISTWELGTSKPDNASIGRLETVIGAFAAAPQAKDNMIQPPLIGAFGAWLRKERTSAGLSINEVAQASGLSLPTIYNIESGKSANPQAETRKSLEKVLKVKVPKDVKEEAEDEQNVPGVGILQHFDPHQKDQLPNLPGVYVFYDVSDRPVYIGKAQNIAS